MHKLIFDNNISHRIISRIKDIFPNSTHVMLKNLDESSDMEIWRYAYKNNYAIVTKDSDFNDIAIYQTNNVKIIWLKIGNCKINEIEQVLRDNEKIIKTFLIEKTSTILEI